MAHYDYVQGKLVEDAPSRQVASAPLPTLGDRVAKFLASPTRGSLGALPVGPQIGQKYVAPNFETTQSWGPVRPSVSMQGLGSLGAWWNPFSWGQVFYSAATDVGALKQDFDNYATSFGNFVNSLSTWLSGFGQEWNSATANIQNLLGNAIPSIITALQSGIPNAVNQMGATITNQIASLQKAFTATLQSVESQLHADLQAANQFLAPLSNGLSNLNTAFAQAQQSLQNMSAVITDLGGQAANFVSAVNTAMQGVPLPSLSGVGATTIHPKLPSPPNPFASLANAIRLMAQAGVVLTRSEQALVAGANASANTLPQIASQLSQITNTLSTMSASLDTLSQALAPLAAAGRAEQNFFSQVRTLFHLAPPTPLHPHVGIAAPSSTGAKTLGEAVYLVTRRRG